MGASFLHMEMEQVTRSNVRREGLVEAHNGIMISMVSLDIFLVEDSGRLSPAVSS